MVEASYNPSMPFKWNAYRIQLLPNESPQSQPQRAPQHPHNGPSQWTPVPHVDHRRDRSHDRDRAMRRPSPPRRSRKLNIEITVFSNSPEEKF